MLVDRRKINIIRNYFSKSSNIVFSLAILLLAGIVIVDLGSRFKQNTTSRLSPVDVLPQQTYFYLAVKDSADGFLKPPVVLSGWRNNFFRHLILPLWRQTGLALSDWVDLRDVSVVQVGLAQLKLSKQEAAVVIIELTDRLSAIDYVSQHLANLPNKLILDDLVIVASSKEALSAVQSNLIVNEGHYTAKVNNSSLLESNLSKGEINIYFKVSSRLKESPLSGLRQIASLLDRLFSLDGQEAEYYWQLIIDGNKVDFSLKAVGRKLAVFSPHQPKSNASTFLRFVPWQRSVLALLANGWSAEEIETLSQLLVWPKIFLPGIEPSHGQGWPVDQWPSYLDEFFTSGALILEPNTSFESSDFDLAKSNLALVLYFSETSKLQEALKEWQDLIVNDLAYLLAEEKEIKLPSGQQAVEIIKQPEKFIFRSDKLSSPNSPIVYSLDTGENEISYAVIDNRFLFIANDKQLLKDLVQAPGDKFNQKVLTSLREKCSLVPNEKLVLVSTSQIIALEPFNFFILVQRDNSLQTIQGCLL